MPAIRSAKGKTPDDDDNNNRDNNNRDDKGKGKGKAQAPFPRSRKHPKDNVDPCEICGVVVSRKSDIPRHAKRHAPDAEKLPCPWEGCKFSTLQKSNLETHYRRHTQEKSFTCHDDPECEFESCDPASLLRHRKRIHGYIPRAVGNRVRRSTKNVAVRVIRGAHGESPGSTSNSVASQFHPFASAEASTSRSSSSRHFSASASTSRSSSSRPFSAAASTSSSPSRPFSAEASASASGSTSSRPLSPPESPTPSPSPPLSPSPSPSPPPVASGSRSRQSPLSISPSPSPSYAPSGSQPRQQSRLRQYSPTHSSGESEVSPTTPVTSAFPHESTTGGPSPTVLSMTSYSVHGRSLMYQHDSLLFGPTIKDVIYVDPYTSEVLDGSWADSSWGSECLDPDQVEVVYDKVSMEGELLSPLFFEKNEWPGVGFDMAGNSLGPYGMPLDEDQQRQLQQQQLSSSTHIEQHPTWIHHITPYHQAHNPPAIEGFHGNGYDHQYDQAQATTPPSPLGLCPTHLIYDCCQCNQSHPPPTSSYFPTPLEIAAATDLDMLMSVDVNNQNFYIQGEVVVDANVDLLW